VKKKMASDALMVKIENTALRQYQEKIGRCLTSGDSKKVTGHVDFYVKGELRASPGSIPKYLAAESIIEWRVPPESEAQK
jgi:hypothetical protein